MSTNRRFELLCIVMLGIGQMCIMTGYDTQSFVQESVIHSIHEREPKRIDQFAGYYGQAVCYASYMISCLISPTILHLIGPKLTLLAGSICFTCYQVGFFYLNSIYYYVSSAIMGAGFACELKYNARAARFRIWFEIPQYLSNLVLLYYTGNGGYLTSHSTRKTVEENSAIVWSIACCCMLAGSGILSAVFAINDQVRGDNHSDTTINQSVSPLAAEEHSYRRFSNSEVLYIYGAFAFISFLANVTFFLIPSREIDNCIEGKASRKKTSIKNQLHLIYSTFTSRAMILLAPNFIHLGFYTCFWVSVYPTSLIFTQSLSTYIYLPAIYSLFVGLGEIVMGFIITYFSRRIKDFGLKPTMCMGFVLSTIVLALIVTSVPEWATVRPTNQDTLLLEPSLYLPMLTAFLIGLADSCVNNVRTVICAIAMPQRRAQAFSISKFYQALGGASMMFISPYLSIYHYGGLLFAGLILSTICFIKVASQTQKMEKQNSEIITK